MKRDSLLAFIGDDPNPEFWAWYASYDWVLLRRLFGRMIDIPEHFPKFVHDLKQTCDEYSISKNELPPEPISAHHALSDAKWLKSAFERVQDIYEKRIENLGEDLETASLNARERRVLRLRLGLDGEDGQALEVAGSRVCPDPRAGPADRGEGAALPPRPAGSRVIFRSLSNDGVAVVELPSLELPAMPAR